MNLLKAKARHQGPPNAAIAPHSPKGVSPCHSVLFSAIKIITKKPNNNPREFYQKMYI